MFTSQGSPAEVSLVCDGPLATVFEVTVRMMLPESIGYDQTARSSSRKELLITNVLTLKKDSRRLDVTTRFENNIKDHRLRVLIPTGISAQVSYADAQFDVVERPIAMPDTSNWIEPAHPTHPQQEFVDLTDGVKGLALISEGLPEFAVLDDEDRTFALTLLRSFNRSVGHNQVQEGGQSLGFHEYRYSLFPHSGDWAEGNLPKESRAFMIQPLLIQAEFHPCQTMRPHRKRVQLAGYRPNFGLIEKVPEGAVVSAVKKADDRDSLVIRLYNPTGSGITGELKLKPEIEECYLLNLLEERLAPCGMSDGSILIELAPKKILTLELVFKAAEFCEDSI